MDKPFASGPGRNTSVEQVTSGSTPASSGSGSALAWNRVWNAAGPGVGRAIWALPSDTKNNLSASCDHLNSNFVLRVFITLKKKSVLDQILRNNIDSGFVIQTVALCCPMGHLFKLCPQNGSSNPRPKVFLFAFNYKWTLYKDPSLPWSNWFIT